MKRARSRGSQRPRWRGCPGPPGRWLYALGLGVAPDRERNLATAFRAWERRERPVTEHTQRWTRIYGNTIFLPRVLKRMSIAAERRIPRIGRQYLHAAHVVPTGRADLVGR